MPSSAAARQPCIGPACPRSRPPATPLRRGGWQRPGRGVDCPPRRSGQGGRAMDGPVLVRDDPGGGVAVLTLNRPAQLNALSDALLAALAEAFAALAEDRATRVVILRGRGGRSAPATTCARCRPAARPRTAGGPISPTSSPLRGGDAGDPAPAPAGDRPGPRHRHRRRLPACGLLRHGGGGRGCPLRRQRRQHRAVLLDADGRAHPRGAAQGGLRDADHRRLPAGGPGRGAGPCQPRRRCRPARGRDAGPCGHRRVQARGRGAHRQARPSTTRSAWTLPMPMPTPAR